ncbi:RING-14 protein [Xylariaceae sp. FL0255]|nr:RING-14 protein [Xylariaceae sp. FL0255]
MKFAQEFRRTLEQEKFPETWVEHAIPYGQLKKCLKKIIKELHDLGLGKDTLPDLLFQYNLDHHSPSSLHPCPRLTISVHLKDGLPVDAALTPATRQFLQSIASKSQPDSDPNQTPLLQPPPRRDMQQIEVPLIFDRQFFDLLQTDVSNIATLEEAEQLKLQNQITSLARDLETAVDPSHGRKATADLNTWRNIFELYLEARIFFSNRETDHGARSTTQAVQQLKWFQDQVVQRHLARKLKLTASRSAFQSFVQINVALLSILKFNEINQVAVLKIIKSICSALAVVQFDADPPDAEFNKQTSLGISKTFPKPTFLAGKVAREVCARMSTELVSVVPQLDDYLCPICFSIAFWPVKLQCQHTFCSRCLVKMSRKGERHCPLCRADNIMLAGPENFDAERAAFLRKYFPDEVKKKIRDSERERNQEIFGPHHGNGILCSVM